MDITISDNLKELRKKKNNTQEDLAEFLAVSINAVSKWERGECYPDIEFLPKIAVFYDTTVDDLLGVGETRKKQKIADYMNQTIEFWKSGDSIACIDLWRNAAKEFPNDNEVMWQLMQALSNAANGLSWSSSGDKSNEPQKNNYLKEAVALGEMLSSKASDQTTMYFAMYRLCAAYNDLGEVDKAIGIANKLPPVWLSKEEAFVRFLKDAELKPHLQQFVLTLINPLVTIIANIHRCDYDNAQKIKIYEKAIQMVILLFENGDYGAQHMWLRDWYWKIATVYAEMHNADAFFENANAAAEHALAYDSLDDDAPHTSLLFNILKTKKNGKVYMYSEARFLLEGTTINPSIN